MLQLFGHSLRAKLSPYSLLSDSFYDEVVEMLMPQNKRRVIRQRANIWDSVWGRLLRHPEFTGSETSITISRTI